MLVVGVSCRQSHINVLVVGVSCRRSHKLCHSRHRTAEGVLRTGHSVPS